MTRRTKLSVTATLSLSIFASIASVAKIYYVYVMYSPMSTSTAFVRIYMSMAVEANVVIIVASMPILAPLFLHRNGRTSTSQAPILPTFQSSIESTSRSSTGPSPWLSRPSSVLKKPFSVRHDSVVGSTIKETETEVDHALKAEALSYQVLKTVDIEVELVELGQVTLEDFIAPEGLQHESGFADYSGQIPDQGSNVESLGWEELPTPQFLEQDDQSLFGVRQ